MQAKCMVLGFFSGVEQLRHEDDHSPPHSSKVKDERSYTCTPPIHLHCMERGNFTFLSKKQTHLPVLAIHSNRDGN
jgi:hypothetical protein